MPNKFRSAGMNRGVEGRARSVIGVASMPKGDSDLGGRVARRPKDATATLREPKEIQAPNTVNVPDRSKNLGKFLHKSKGTGLQDIQKSAISIEEDK